MSDAPLWYSNLSYSDYIKIIISGCLGMGIGDALFIYALSQIGANRVAIINCFEPAVIYFFSIIMLGTLLTIQQLIGFSIVMISILIVTYEKDFDDINPQKKHKGLLKQGLGVRVVMLSSRLLRDEKARPSSLPLLFHMVSL